MSHTTDIFAAGLPKGPLVQQLASVHAIVMHLGPENDARLLVEHHLREIALFTQTPIWVQYGMREYR